MRFMHCALDVKYHKRLSAYAVAAAALTAVDYFEVVAISFRYCFFASCIFAFLQIQNEAKKLGSLCGEI
ncbi:Hypothetical predicted protein [Octopus vulgaris]|uniref:Uncharacterized protein n=1 Tax=Octopus vulgaris TaxID=6645 RepID=A0AA36FC08_OCTVU|nr:Hypothetical predicted protein [Octopus vulgaris]